MLAPSFMLQLLICDFAYYFGGNLLNILFDHINILQIPENISILKTYHFFTCFSYFHEK